MFYQYKDKLTPVPPEAASSDMLTVAFLTGEELAQVAPAIGIAPAAVAACERMNAYFRSGVEVYDDYTFTQLRVSDPGNVTDKHYCVALFIKKNLLVLVDVQDTEGTIKKTFTSVIGRFTAANVTAEKLVSAFLDALVANDAQFLERTGFEISALEEDVMHNDTDKDFSLDLLKVKKELLVMHNFYEQLLDITEALEEDDNDLFDVEELRYLSNITTKLTRLREDVDSLNNSVVHLQDAYQSTLDLKLNNSMKFFTVITSIFFPLTIIVGWYGMNFEYMPEFHWRWGYVFVITLSVVTVGVLTFVAKKRRWF